MDNYYQKLSLAPSAPTAEIQAAIESQYNQVRRLVNHHDPNIVNQANQALIVLEQMRTTLLDESRRAAYDASVGLGAPTVGGVADPSLEGQTPLATQTTVAPNMANFAVPVMRPLQPMAPVQPVTTGWICQSCGSNNPAGTMFCASCGKEVGRVCPNCAATYESRSRFCPSCGVPYESAARRNEITNQITKLRTQRYQVESQANASSSMDLRSIQFLWVMGGGWSIITILTTAIYLLAAVFRLVFSFLPGDVMYSEWMRVIVQILSFIFSLARWGIFVGVLAFFYLYLEKRRGMKADRLALAALGGAALLGVLFGGPSFLTQALSRSGNLWLIFPALVAGGLFLWFGITFSQAPETNQGMVVPVPALQPYQSYADKAFGISQKSPWIFSAAGIGISLALLIFSGASPIISIIAAVVALVTGALLYMVTYRAWSQQDIQRDQFEARRRAAQEQLAKQDGDIAALESELNALAAAMGRK